MLHREIYKGFEIVIDDGEPDAVEQLMEAFTTEAYAMEAPMPVQNLAIADRSIDVAEDELGRFSTSFLPYTNYSSVIDLAKAVIDHTAEFDTLTDQ